MKTARLALRVLATAVATLLPGSARSTPIGYGLEPESQVVSGCMGPCACAVMFRDSLDGDLRLVFESWDGVYSHYRVDNVRWRLPDGGALVTGGGHYQVGGEVAAQQRMTLDLEVAGAPPRRFDSGLVPGGGAFPRIEIDVPPDRIHGCFDTLYRVIAEPGAPVGVEGGRALTSLRVVPNPSVRSLEVELALSRRARVGVRIVDLAGREVRTLAAGEWMEAGTRRLVWDGRRADGMAAPAGLYFVRTRVGGESATRAAVRLR